MKKEDRVNEIINGIQSFSKNEYRKDELLPELLKLQDEIVKISFNEENQGMDELKLQDVEYYFEKLNEEKNFIASKELSEFKKDSKDICNQIKSEISGNKGEELTFTQLERVHERKVIIKNLELKNGDTKSEIDAVVITPKSIFIIEVKNTHRDIFIDENGDYYRVGKYNKLDSNIKQKIDIKEELLRNTLSDLGLKEINITKLVVFTNKYVEVQNKCRTLKTTFLSRLPYLIDQHVGKFIYTQGEMNEIGKVLEESRCKEAYPVSLDINKFKMSFAHLIAALEGCQEETTVQKHSFKSFKNCLNITRFGLLALILVVSTISIKKQAV